MAKLPPAMLTLRGYQSDMLQRARERLSAGVRRLLLVGPCGMGKTVLMAAMARGAVARGKRVHVWAHRKELIDQTVRTFIEAADIHTGVIAAGSPSSPLAPVQVCSVQTLARRASRVAAPDIIVVDEAHHQASATYAALAAQFPDALQIGLTASPLRLDGRGLGVHFDEMIVGPSTKDLIAQGFLSNYKLFAPSLGPSLAGVHTLAGDFKRNELADAMEHSTVIGDALGTYQQHCPSARALMFLWSVESSQALAERFRFMGITAKHVDGETPAIERRGAMDDFRSGALRVLCNCQLFSEGVDVEGVDAVFLLRPTQSLSLYIQQTGRALRPSPGKTALVFDHVNNWQRHGLPDDPRVWSLSGRTVRPRDTEAAQGKRCLKCFGVSPVSAVVCRLCGVPFVREGRAVTEVAGTLEAVNLDVLRQLGLVGAVTRVCQRCGRECAKRFCGSACYLAARRLWTRSA